MPTAEVAIPKATSRKPTGKPAWPRVLLSGEEGAHKSTEAAKLSADSRIGGMYWLEVGAGENTADEYGSLDGVDYEIIDHDGTWVGIYGQLCAHWELAKAAEDRNEAPIVLVLDAAHGVYGMLLEWGDVLARRRLEKQIKNDNRDRRDPATAWHLDTEAQKAPDIWNSINRRWGQFMAKVLTWPGPAVLIAAEKLVTPFVNGQPDPRAPKEWTMDGAPKNLPRQCTSWVRMTRGNNPQIIKLRSAKEANAVAAGEDRPVTRPNFSCAALIFDWIGCESGVSRAPRHVELDADQTMPGEGDDVAGATTAAEQRPAPPANSPGGDGKSDAGVQRIDDLAKKKRDAYQRAIEASKTLGMSKAEFEKELRSEQGVGWTDGTAAQFTTFAQSLEQIAEAGKTPAVDGQGELAMAAT